MPAHTRVAGVWKQVTGIYVRVSGVWKQVTNGYVRVSGVWKEFHSLASAATVLFTPSFVHNVTVGSTSVASFTVQRDGDLITVGNIGEASGANDWIDPRTATVGDGWHVRLTKNSGGDPSSGPALGAWHALTSNRQWTMTQAVDGTSAGNFTIAFSNDAGSTTFYSKSFDFISERTSF